MTKTKWFVLALLVLALAAPGLYLYKKHWSSGSAAAAGGTPAKPDDTMAGMPGDNKPSNPSTDATGGGQIYIAPERQQLIGVKTASAEMKSLA
jgi:hypothetical protein